MPKDDKTKIIFEAEAEGEQGDPAELQTAEETLVAKFKQMRSEGLFMNPFKKEAGSLSPEQQSEACLRKHITRIERSTGNGC